MFSRLTSSARLLSTRVSHSSFRVVTASVGASAALFAAYKWSTDLSTAQCAVDPEYTPEDVARHKTAKDRIWVSYKDEVFDITDFVLQHPGGQSRIMLAAGGAIDPFWQLYAQHTNNPEVSKILHQFRIGKLKRPAGQPVSSAQDPYANDPARSPFFKVSAAKPFNAEPPLPLLVDTHHTPNDAFFVRNHLPVPQVNGDQYQLKVEVEGQPQTLKISLKDLETKFQQYAVVASVQCAGNRRGEMIELKPIKGLGWNAGAISNAQWTGVLLRDVLQAAGFSDKDLTNYSHVQFEGLDRDMTGTFYGSSIPLDKAWDPKGDVLLALTMNGQPLPRDHGYPVRVVAPGVVGARSVKWLDKIVVSGRESNAHWQQKDYKGFQPAVDWADVKWDSAPAIQTLPVTSAICEPTPDMPAHDEDDITVKGYAISGGGHAVVRVDVSADGGKSWITANLKPSPTGRVSAPADGSLIPLEQWPTKTAMTGAQLAERAWAWTQWEAQVPLTKEMRAAACASQIGGKPCQLELISRAVDSAYNNQPDTVAPIWNLRGVVNNAWHRTHIEVSPPE